MTELCEAVGWSTGHPTPAGHRDALQVPSVCTRGHRPRTRASQPATRQHDHHTGDQSQDNSYTGAHSTTTFRLSSGQTADPGCRTSPLEACTRHRFAAQLSAYRTRSAVRGI